MLKSIRNSAVRKSSEISFVVSVSVQRPEGIEMSPELANAFDEGAKKSFRSFTMTMPAKTTLTPTDLLEKIHEAIGEQEQEIMARFSGVTEQAQKAPEAAKANAGAGAQPANKAA